MKCTTTDNELFTAELSRSEIYILATALREYMRTGIEIAKEDAVKAKRLILEPESKLYKELENAFFMQVYHDEKESEDKK